MFNNARITLQQCTCTSPIPGAQRWIVLGYDSSPHYIYCLAIRGDNAVNTYYDWDGIRNEATNIVNNGGGCMVFTAK